VVDDGKPELVAAGSADGIARYCKEAVRETHKLFSSTTGLEQDAPGAQMTAAGESEFGSLNGRHMLPVGSHR
jgi:hypothetical protein